MNTILNLNEVINVNLTCLEQGLDNKAAVRENILKAIAENCFPIREARELEDFPVEFFQTLHDRLGLAFIVHNGMIAGVDVEPGFAFREELEQLVNIILKGARSWQEITAAIADVLTMKGATVWHENA